MKRSVETRCEYTSMSNFDDGNPIYDGGKLFSLRFGGL